MKTLEKLWNAVIIWVGVYNVCMEFGTLVTYLILRNTEMFKGVSYSEYRKGVRGA